jgi:hypothetical protein
LKKLKIANILTKIARKYLIRKLKKVKYKLQNVEKIKN